MEKTGWKILAIINMVILGLLIAVIVLGVSMVNDEEQKNYECGLECDRDSECVMSYYDIDLGMCSQTTYNDLQRVIDYR